MKTISQQLKKSLRWTSIEAFLYQTILFVHQIFLFQKTSEQTYGQISIIFSLIFLATTVVSLGLDQSIGPFFETIKQSKNNFKSFFITHICSHFFISITLATFFTYIISLFFPKIFLTNKYLLFFIPFIIVGQSFYKIIKPFLYLLFYNRALAFLQASSIILYTAFVWIPYFYGYKICVMQTVAPMALISIVPSAIILCILYNFYKKLPEKDTATLPKSFHKKIIASRFFTYLTQINKLLFSNNFLVPLIALYFGHQQAGILKFISHIARYISSLFRTIFGNISQSLFAATKNMQNSIKKEVFTSLFNKLINVFYMLGIFSCINYNKIVHFHTNTINLPITYCYLFLFIIISENLFTVYEKWFINEEKAHFVFIFNVLFSVLTVASITILTTYNTVSSLYGILNIIVVIRALLFLFIINILQLKKKDIASVKLNYMLATLCFSGLFFILF